MHFDSHHTKAEREQESTMNYSPSEFIIQET